MTHPFAFGYGTGTVSPAGNREIRLSEGARALAMTWSDLASGALLAAFGWWRRRHSFFKRQQRPAESTTS